ncbi:MAG: HlyD family efflux transporter periplasmic adaptor subunit [Bacillota bacterium]
MKFKMKHMGKVAAIVVVGAGIFAVSPTLYNGLMSYASGSGSATANATTETQNLYREETVERKDIVVGVTEMGTAQLNTTLVTYDVDVDISGVEVKEGQYITTGTKIADVSLAADVDLASEYYSQYSSLLLSLESARLDHEKLLLDIDMDRQAVEKKLQEDLAQEADFQTTYSYAQTDLTLGYEKLMREMEALEIEKAAAEAELAAGYINTSTTIDDAQYDLGKIQDSMNEVMADLYHVQHVCKTYVYAESATSNNTITVYSCGNDEREHDEDKLLASYDSLLEQFETAERKLEQLLASQELQVESWETQMQETIDKLETSIFDKNLEIDAYETSTEQKEASYAKDYEDAVYTLSTAESTYTSSMMQLDNEIRKSELSIQNYLDSIAELELYVLDDAVVTAPCDGYVVSVVSDSTVRSEGTVATIGDAKHINVLVSVAQEDIADVQIGMKANVIFDAYDNVTVPSVVDSISMSTAGMSTTVNYVVTILCDITEYPDLVVYGGMTGNVTFVQREANDVISISNKCVSTVDGKQYVKMIDSMSGEIYLHEIKTGFSDGFEVEVTEGLSEGDVIILESAVTY